MGLTAQAWPFVHPALAAAALAAGLIPVLIHLMHRRRHVRMPWAAMHFLLAAARRSARRVWFEHFLLMLTRVALIVLFGMAVARPYVPASALLPLRPSSVHHVLMLDNSLSMKAVLSDGRTRFSRAQQAALDLLESLPQVDAVSLIILADPAEAVIAQPSVDRRFVRDRVAALEATFRAADAPGALRAAVDALQSADFPPENRMVYLISDLPRNTWAGPTPVIPSPAVLAARQLADALEDPSSQWVVVPAAFENRPNVAVTSLEAATPLIGIGLPVRLHVTVANFGSRPVEGLALQIRLTDRVVRTESVATIAPADSTDISLSLSFPAAGTHVVEARLVESQRALSAGSVQALPPGMDALSDDNVRYLSLELASSRNVLLVDGRPGATPLAGQAGYLATALLPAGRHGAPAPDRGFARDQIPIRPKTIPPAALHGEALPEYDVIALCNVRRLREEDWRQIGEFVQRGGGLLVTLGRLADAEHYNEFAVRDVHPLLPVRLTTVYEAPARGLDDSVTHPTVSFAPADTEHPIVTEFTGLPDSSLFAARVDRYFLTEPVTLEASHADVALRFTTGDPALIASTFGIGRVLLFTTTANMDWTNLPAKGDYVSLFLNALAWLAPQRGQHRNLNIGDLLLEPLDAAEISLPLQVATSHGRAIEPLLVPRGDRIFLQFGPIETPGTYPVAVGTDLRVFAANVDPSESDLTPVDEASLPTILNREVRLLTHPGLSLPGSVVGQARELGSMLAVGVFVLLLVESILAMRFGSHHR